jgi:hypothetical protein
MREVLVECTPGDRRQTQVHSERDHLSNPANYRRPLLHAYPARRMTARIVQCGKMVPRLYIWQPPKIRNKLLSKSFKLLKPSWLLGLPFGFLGKNIHISLLQHVLSNLPARSPPPHRLSMRLLLRPRQPGGARACGPAHAA